MKIYISSTFEDLKDYRERVYRQLRKLRHDVISMEDYVAGDQRPLKKCLQDVESADVYVGIIAWRYGYIPSENNPEKLSITELEYRHALKSNKQCLLFILDKSASWPAQCMDVHSDDKANGKRVAKFRAQLSERHTIAWFNNSEQLASDVLCAIHWVQLDTPIKSSPKVKPQIPHSVTEPIPSVLAIGFFDNFINPVCSYLFDTEVEIDGMSYKSYELQVLLPDNLKENMRMKASEYFHKNGFKDCTLNFLNGRGIRTVSKADEKDPSKLVICDLPVALNSLNRAITLYMTKVNVGVSSEHSLIVARELKNFRDTLQLILDENVLYKNTVRIIEV